MSDLHSTQKSKPQSTIVLVGMMVAGKSAVGRRLAQRLGLPFVDSDAEIEAASGMTISQFFEKHGESEFRKGERRVIARLLQGEPAVISTGGGAFMDAETRALIHDKATSIWLKADIEILMKRAARKDDRPLLQGGDLRMKLQELIKAREPIYAEADITVTSDESPIDDMVARVLNAFESFCKESALT
jgi:shikimate kinase